MAHRKEDFIRNILINRIVTGKKYRYTVETEKNIPGYTGYTRKVIRRTLISDPSKTETIWRDSMHLEGVS